MLAKASIQGEPAARMPVQRPMILAKEEPHDDLHHYRLRTVTRWRQGTGA